MHPALLDLQTIYKDYKEISKKPPDKLRQLHFSTYQLRYAQTNLNKIKYQNTLKT